MFARYVWNYPQALAREQTLTEQCRQLLFVVGLNKLTHGRR